MNDQRRPKVLLPYQGPSDDEDSLDIFVSLRPETNGVEVESTIMGVVKKCGYYGTGISLVYLANVPGDYIVERHIVERRYALRLYFAVHGGLAFTDDMRRQFESHYETEFVEERVIGAFEALRTYELSPTDLFSLWVDARLVARVAGQVIKPYKDVYLVNYDIPALLHKTTSETDIAVMVFRTTKGYPRFFELSEQIHSALTERGLLNPNRPIGRAAHISRSPCEQLLDARSYLLADNGEAAPLESSSFAQFLLRRGFVAEHVGGLLDCPIFRFAGDERGVADEHIFDMTEGKSYAETYRILQESLGQLMLPPHRFLSRFDEEALTLQHAVANKR